MNRYAFNVFLEKQQIDEVYGKAAAVAARTAAKSKAGAKLGAASRSGGLTRAMARKRELAKAQAPELAAKIKTLKGKAAGDPAKMAALQKQIDTTKRQITNPANVAGPRGDLRRQRLAKAAKLADRGGKGSLLGRAKSAIGKRIRALDTPQNRERLKAAGRAGMEYFRTGGISGRFNDDHSERGSGSGTHYQSQFGALGGAVDRQIKLRRARERSGEQSQTDDLRGLQPSEKQDVTGSAGPVQRRTVKTTQQAIPRETKGPKGTPAVS